MRRVFILWMILLLAVPAWAREETRIPRIPELQPVMTTYNVYVGGIHFITANILFQQDKKKYRTRVEGSTQGFWNDIVPWNTVLEAQGSIRKNQFVPATFHTRDVWGKKPKVTRLNFDRHGNVSAEFEPPSHDKKPDAVSAAQTRGALDPVSALLQMLGHVATEQDCAISVPVFDGKRRFDLDGVDMGEEYIDEDDYGVYKGTARVCDVSFNMVAGEWRENKKNLFWQNEKGENAREPFRIYLASLAPKLPQLPVRLETGSAWGNIVLHLAEWHYATSAEIEAKPGERGF